MKTKAGFFVVLIGIGCGLAFGQVDSQWRGPGRDGVYPGERLLQDRG